MHTCTRITAELTCEFAQIAWRISDGHWLVSAVYDSTIDSQPLDLSEKIACRNGDTIPVRHRRLTLQTRIYADCISVTADAPAQSQRESVELSAGLLEELFAQYIVWKNKEFASERSRIGVQICEVVYEPMNEALAITNSVLATDRLTDGTTDVTDYDSYTRLKRNLLRMSNSIMNISQLLELRNGTYTPELEWRHVSEWFADVTSITRSICNTHSRNISVCVELDSDASDEMLADWDGIKQVVVEFIRWHVKTATSRAADSPMEYSMRLSTRSLMDTNTFDCTVIIGLSITESFISTTEYEWLRLMDATVDLDVEYANSDMQLAFMLLKRLNGRLTYASETYIELTIELSMPTE